MYRVLQPPEGSRNEARVVRVYLAAQTPREKSDSMKRKPDDVVDRIAAVAARLTYYVVFLVWGCVKLLAGVLLFGLIYVAAPWYFWQRTGGVSLPLFMLAMGAYLLVLHLAVKGTLRWWEKRRRPV